MGLRICRNIVTDLGGRIWFTSPGPGEGAVVEWNRLSAEAGGGRRGGWRTRCGFPVEP